MKGSDLGLYLLMTVIIFVAVGFVMLKAFGSPNCNAMANITAEQLKAKINNVVENYGEYTGDGVPTDPVYYEEAQITLCQDNAAYAYLQSFMGGFPQHQIYYEKFPEGFFEGGAWMWTENYPWSGGAASSMFFWGALKLGTYAAKGLKYLAFAKVKLGMSATTTIYKMLTKRSVFIEELKGSAKIMQKIEGSPALRTAYNAFRKSGSAEDFVKIIGRADAENMVDEMARNGWLAVDDLGNVLVTSEGKQILSKDAKPVKMIVQEVGGDGTVRNIEKTVFVKKGSDGEIIESVLAVSSSEAGSGFERLEFVPHDAMKEYVEDLAKTNKDSANLLREMYEFGDVSTWTKLADLGIENTNMYNKIYDATAGKLKTLFRNIKNAGRHNLEKTTIDATGAAALKQGTLKALDDETVYKNLVEPGINLKTSLKESIAKKFKLSSVDKIEKRHIIEFVNSMPSSGIWVLPKESSFNVDRVIVNHLVDEDNFGKYLEDAATGSSRTKTEIFNKVKGLEGFENMPESKFNSVYSEIENLITGQDKVNGKIERLYFETQTNKEFLLRIANKLKENPADEEAAKEFGIILGFLTQDTDLMPISIPRAYGQQEIDKMLYIDGTAMVNPNSWIMKNFVGDVMTEQCEGNSICVYSQAVMAEAPHYLDAEAQDYFIRVWRPVNPFAQYGSLQIAMMHVPEHPRFYLVSPCFGKAKIWKGSYQGEKTIFIAMEKCDSGTSNYCYADENLINQYAAIWAASDYADLALTFASGGTRKVLKVPKLIKEFAGKAVDIDPATITQSMLEAAISWPGYPWADLTYEKMRDAAQTCATTELSKEIKK